MSNCDPNAAAPGTLADGAIAVDEACAPRVYNYMATGVGLTGLVAMLTYQFTGPELLQSPLMWVFMLAPLAPVFFISARVNTLSVRDCYSRLSSLDGIVASYNLPRIHRRLD